MIKSYTNNSVLSSFLLMFLFSMSHLNVVQNLSVAGFRQKMDCNTYQSEESLLPAKELWCHKNSGIQSQLDR